MKCFRLCRVVFIVLLVTLGGWPAIGGEIAYEITGRFVAVDSPDDLGLDGAHFRLSVRIDAAAIEAFREQSAGGQRAIYDSTRSMLQLSGSSDPALNGNHDAFVERLEVSETYGSDYCLEFGASFRTEAGIVSVPRLCFKPGSVGGLAPPAAGVSPQNLVGFATQQIGSRNFAIADGSIFVAGGAQ